MTNHRTSSFSNIFPLTPSQIPTDIFAGLSLVALAIPQALAYTNIAGTPVIMGLYTILLPPILFALFGSSRLLTVGADSATAAIMASGLTSIFAIGSPEYAACASLLALMTGIFLLLARVINLGFLSDFLSRTVLVGFLTGVGFKIAIAQIPEILGLPGRTVSLKYPLMGLIKDFQEISQTNFYTFALSIAVFAVIFGTSKYANKIPGGLFAVIGSMAASFFFDLSSKNVSIIGKIPGGLPMLAMPTIEITWNLIEKLVPIAFSLVIMIVAQSAATSRAFATRFRDTVDENRNLTGLSLANLGAGFSGAFVVNGSPTETQVVANSGGRSQLAQITSASVVLIVLLFFTAPLAYLPKAVLASLVFLIGKDLIDLKEMKRIHALSQSEFWVAAITAALVIFVGVEQAILAAIVMSLIDHTRRGYRPKNNLVSFDTEGNRQAIPIEKRTQIIPGLIIYRFNHSMYYANSNHFSKEVLDLVDESSTPVSWFCLDGTSVDDIDFSAAATLTEIYQILKQKGIRFVFSGVENHLLHQMERYGLIELFGKDAFYSSYLEVETAFRASQIQNALA